MSAPPPTIDDVIYAIRAYAHSQGWAYYEVAKRAKIGPTTLREFWKERWAPNTLTLRILRDLVPDDFDPAKAAPPPIEPDDGPSRQNGRSGVHGVNWNHLKRKWAVYKPGMEPAYRDGRHVSGVPIAFFDSFEDAVAARRKAEARVQERKAQHGPTP